MKNIMKCLIFVYVAFVLSGCFQPPAPVTFYQRTLENGVLSDNMPPQGKFGNYDFIAVYDKEYPSGILDGLSLINKKTGEKIDKKFLVTNYVGQIKVFFGTVGDMIYYTYTDKTSVAEIFYKRSRYYLEAYNTKTKKAYTIMDSLDENSIAFLRSNNKIVMQIFKDKQQHLYSLSYNGNYASAEHDAINSYNLIRHKPSTYVDLETLKEYNEISKDFKPIALPFIFHNMTGDNPLSAMIVGTFSDFRHAIRENIYFHNYGLMF